MHVFSYYVMVSVLAGLFQSTGWPSVVSIVANWSGKGKRGLIMGIWNANTSVGNILGTVVAAALLSWVGAARWARGGGAWAWCREACGARARTSLCNWGGMGVWGSTLVCDACTLTDYSPSVSGACSLGGGRGMRAVPPTLVRLQVACAPGSASLDLPAVLS